MERGRIWRGGAGAAQGGRGQTQKRNWRRVRSGDQREGVQGEVACSQTSDPTSPAGTLASPSRSLSPSPPWAPATSHMAVLMASWPLGSLRPVTCASIDPPPRPTVLAPLLWPCGLGSAGLLCDPGQIAPCLCVLHVKWQPGPQLGLAGDWRGASPSPSSSAGQQWGGRCSRTGASSPATAVVVTHTSGDMAVGQPSWSRPTLVSPGVRLFSEPR